MAIKKVETQLNVIAYDDTTWEPLGHVVVHSEDIS